MKFSKKIIALFAVASMMVSSAITASAAFSGITVTEDLTAEVGEVITLEATFDTLVNAKGAQLNFSFDDDAFEVDTADNTAYNFGTSRVPKYHPMWMSEDFLVERNEDEGYSTTLAWGTMGYSYNDLGLSFAFYDSDNHVITEDDEDFYGNNTVGVNLTVAKAGTHTVTVKAIVSDATVGDIVSEKTIKVTVAGGEDDNKPVDMVAGVDEIAYGRHEGKASIVTPTAVDFDGLAKIVVSNSKAAETQTWEAPKTLGEGKSSVLAIITYDKDVWADSTFTVNFLDATEKVIKAFTYKVQ